MTGPKSVIFAYIRIVRSHETTVFPNRNRPEHQSSDVLTLAFDIIPLFSTEQISNVILLE